MTGPETLTSDDATRLGKAVNLELTEQRAGRLAHALQRYRQGATEIVDLDVTRADPATLSFERIARD